MSGESTSIVVDLFHGGDTSVGTVANNGNTQIYIILLHSISQYTNIFIGCASIFISTIKYTPVQQYVPQYRNVNFSRKI